jgi:hypothetical protein
MERNDALQQLSDIRSLMSRSSRFLSLSGLSGILAGVYSVAGALAARAIMSRSGIIRFSLTDRNFVLLLLIAGGVMLLSLVTAIVLSGKQAKKAGEPMWNSTSRRLVINFVVPMTAGGIFCVLLMSRGYYALLAPATMLVYGFSLLHVSKYTLETIRVLAYSFLILALIGVVTPRHNLLLWTIGFGGLHLFYGALFYVLPKRIR